jgi:Flp pilus assembly protein TadD
MRWGLWLLLAFAAGAQAATAQSASKAAALKRDTASCTTQANLDACYDAIRWNPSDPALLVATGDALMRAGRPADAIRIYHRAAQLAPTTRGLAAKINAAEAKVKALSASLNRRYTNAAPESQSH